MIVAQSGRPLGEGSGAGLDDNRGHLDLLAVDPVAYRGGKEAAPAKTVPWGIATETYS